jgi:hypothetical protein
LETKQTEVNPVRSVFHEVQEALELQVVTTIIRFGQTWWWMNDLPLRSPFGR